MKASKSPLRATEYISTGMAPLDEIMGGGIRMRRITQFSGEPSTGKTTTAYMAVAGAQKKGYKVIWFDTEKRFEYDFAESLGVDLDKLELEYENIAEDIFDKTEDWATKNDGLIVIDSIGGLVTRKEFESKNEATFPDAPKLIPAFTRRLVLALCTHPCAALLLNHEKKDFEGRLKVLGGIAIPYHCSTWVRFRRTPKKVMQGDEEISSWVEAKINKGKNFHKTCLLNQMSTGGFDLQAFILEDALYRELIRKDGNSYYIGEEKICVGMPKLREWAAANVSTLEELIKGV